MLQERNSKRNAYLIDERIDDFPIDYSAITLATRLEELKSTIAILSIRPGSDPERHVCIMQRKLGKSPLALKSCVYFGLSVSAIHGQCMVSVLTGPQPIHLPICHGRNTQKTSEGTLLEVCW